MAAVVHELWVQQDRNLLIMPATIPIETAAVQSLFTQYLEELGPNHRKGHRWCQSLPRRLDNANSNLGRYSATRRVARSIFFGSAPTLQSANKGIQDTHIKLGCTQPGESVATFGDALRRLTDQATYLYQNDRRYWYDTQPSVARLAQDRASQQDDDTVYAKIKDYLRGEEQKKDDVKVKGHLKVEQRQKGDFASIHLCPESGADVIDENSGLRLVILKPQYPHARRDQTRQQ